MIGKDIWEKFGDYMSAAAFAEAGEADTAAGMLRRRRTVLLVLTPRGADGRSAEYARSVCARIGAEMEIMVLPAGNAQVEFVRGYRERLAAEVIVSRVVKASGCIRQRILEHTSRRKDIQFVAVGSPEELQISCERESSRSRRGFLARLRCPLVVVSEAPANP